MRCPAARRPALTPFGTILLLALASSGCSQPSTEPAETADLPEAANQVAAGEQQLVTAPQAQASSNPRFENEATVADTQTPAQILAEIRSIKLRPVPPAASADELRSTRRKRNDEIIQLATYVIRETHGHAKEEDAFNLAVHEVIEARLQVAIQGEQPDIDMLYSDVEALESQYPQSNAARDGTLALVRLAHTFARQAASDETKWIEEFSRLARLFAERYPSESARAVPLLFAAGRTCELHGLLDHAKPCYSLLKKRFADTSQGQQSFGILRRLELVGQPMQLQGLTLGGKQFDIKETKAATTVVYFWSSQEAETIPLAASLTELDQKYRRHGLRFVGVNLDEREEELRAFANKHTMPGAQLFHDDPDARRWENPSARFYGILKIPSLWVVNSKCVTTANPSLHDLESKVREALISSRNATP